MGESKNYDSFIFTHIPKCGGTSFRQLINDSAIASGISVDKLYIPGFNGMANNKNIGQLKGAEREEFKSGNYKIIAAHSKFNLHKEYELKLKSPFYYTILRDPIKRFVSHYHFFYYKLGYDNLKGVAIKELSDEKLIFLVKRLSNIQTDYLASFKFKKVLGEENMLKLAKYNLQYEYADFGIIDNMKKSIERLRLIQPNWLHIEGNLPNLNTSSSKSHKINDDIKKLILEHNQNDYQLLEFGKRLIHSKEKAHI